MLGKLIKYDLKFILKSVSIYIIILLACTLLLNLTAYDSTCEIIDDVPVCTDVPIFLQITHAIFWNAFFAIMIGLVLNAVIRTWARFKINLYHDEAYLTHTLPISRSTLWASKFITAVIVTLVVIGSVALGFLILQLTPSGKNLVMSCGIGVPNADPFYYVVFILAVFTQILYGIMCGYTGIIIGNRAKARNNFRALVCGLAVYLLGVFVMLGCFLIWSTFDDGIHAMLFTSMTSQSAKVLSGEGFINKALTGAGIVYVMMIAALYFIDRKFLTDGVNVD